MSQLLQRMRAMRGALALSSALLLLGAALCWFAWENHDARAKVERDRIALEKRIRQETLAMRATETDARHFIESYDRLARLGVVGTWDKLAAIDRFENALAPWSGRIGRYTVALSRDGERTPDPMSPASAPSTIAIAPAAAGAGGVVASPSGSIDGDSTNPGSTRHSDSRARFSVEMQPTDEVDLLAALDAAAHASLGIADIERCEITRRSGSDKAELAATCTLAWHFFAPGAVAPGALAKDARSLARSIPGRPPRPAASIRLARLFFEPADRGRSGAIGIRPTLPGAAAPPPRATVPTVPRRVQGYLRRSDGPDVVWVDDKPSILADPRALSDRDATLREGTRLRPLDEGNWRRDRGASGR